MAIKKFNAVAGLSVGENVVFEVIDSVANVSANNLSVAGQANLGPVSNVKITGGTTGYVLSTDGLGNLVWINNDAGAAGSNTQIQFNNNGTLSGDANLTFNTTTDTLSTTNIVLEPTGSLSGGNLVSANFLTGTLTTSAQTNITSVGLLTSLSIGPNSSLIMTGDSGYVRANSIQGIDGVNAIYPSYAGVTGAVGITSNLTVGIGTSGNITANGNVTANYFIGNGSSLTGISASNVNGTVANANYAAYAGNVVNASQPNITSLGTLSTVTVTGNATVGGVKTDNYYYANGQPLDFSQPGGLTGYLQFNDNGNFAGSANLVWDIANNTLNATKFSGNGSGLSNLNASNISGQVSNALVAGTVYTAAQPNITSLGTLTGLSVSGTTTLTGNVTIDGTLANLSVGNLSVQDNVIDLSAETTGTPSNNAGLRIVRGDELSVQLRWTESALAWQFTNDGVNYLSIVGKDAAGNIAVSNANLGNLAVANFFSGSGNLLSNIQGANVSGVVTNANYAVYAGNVTGASQPNITSVGTLSSLSVTGNITSGNATLGNAATANYFIGNGSLLTGIVAAASASNVSNGTSNVNIPTSSGNVTVSVSGTSNVAIFTSTGVNVSGYLTTTGNIASGNANLGNLVTANYFSGNGSLLTSITGGNVTGQVANAVVAGTVTTAAQPNITSLGTLSSLSVSGNIASGNANLGNLVTANFFSGSGNLLSNIQAANITGTIGNANYAAYAGNVVNASQPNITSFGTLTTLTVDGVSNLGSISNVKITGGLAGYTIITDGTGNLTWTAAAGGSGGGFTNITKDTFTGTGVQTTFNLTATPSSTDAVQVVINGMVQLESVYTVSGSSIIFSTAPFNGQKIEVTTYGVTAITASSGQVAFAESGNFSGSNSFTFNSTTNTLSVTNVTSTGNVSAGNIKTDSILYANGSPYVFTTNPAGSNTQIQFNDSNVFAASANLTFNKTTNTLSTYNIVAGNSVTVTNGTVILDTGTIAVSGGSAGIFNSGVSNINLGLVANITMGSTTGNVTVQGNLSVANSATITNLKVNDFYSNRTPITVTTGTIVDSFSVNKYRSAKYTMRVNSDDGYQAVEVLLIHDNTNSYVTIYGSLSTVGTDIITLSTDINSGNVRLLATTGSANTTVNLLGTYIAD